MIFNGFDVKNIKKLFQCNFKRKTLLKNILHINIKHMVTNKKENLIFLIYIFKKIFLNLQCVIISIKKLKTFLKKENSKYGLFKTPFMFFSSFLGGFLLLLLLLLLLLFDAYGRDERHSALKRDWGFIISLG